MSEFDIIIFISFFLVILLIGFKFKSLKESFENYAVGDKKMPTHLIVFTMLASTVSGSMFFVTLESTYYEGYFFILASLIGVPIGFLILGRILGPKMGRYMHCLTAPDIVGSVYGKNLQAFVALGFLISEVGTIAIQFKVIARVFISLFNMDPVLLATISGIIVIIYSSHGGIKAIAFTHMLKFLMFCIFMPILLVIMFIDKNPDVTLESLSHVNPNFDLKKVFFSGDLKFISLLIYSIATPLVGAGMFQRMLMASTTEQIKSSITYSSIAIFFIRLAIITISVIALIDNPTLEPKSIINHVAQNYSYEGLRGLLALVLMSLSISSATSTVHSSSVIITNDILPVFGLEKESRLKAAKIMSYILGALGIFVGIKMHNFLDIVLLSADFSIPILLIPLVTTVLGIHVKRFFVYASIICALITTVISMNYMGEHGAFLPGLVISLLIYAIGYFSSPKTES